MRKRVIIAHNKLLEEKLREANNVIKTLNEEIYQLKDQISILSKNADKSQDSIYKELEENETEVFSEDNKDLTEDTAVLDFSEDVEEHDDSFDNPPIENGFIVNCFVNDSVLDSAVENNTVIADDNDEYAVSLVAKIILECTKADLRVSSSNLASAAEDKNIILGEAETAKQRIFEILDENTPSAEQKNALDDVVNSYVQKVKNVLSKY